MPTREKTSTSTSVPEFTKVDTEDVLFDPQNPRLGSDTTTNQPKLQALLMEEPHFAKELVSSFVENGFIEYEPLVVRKSGKQYYVIDGNRRLAAVKHILANRDQYPSSIVKRLERVPVLIFHQKADSAHRKEIRTYLGVRHLQGYREWPPESKAMFLDQNITATTDFKRLKAEFGIERRDIARYLIPYRVRKAAKDILGELELGEEHSFWILGEALQRPGIREYLELDVDANSFKIRNFSKVKFQYLLEFLYGSSKQHGRGRAGGLRRITDTRQLSRLAKVLANKRACEKLENGSTLEEAELYVATPEETIDGLISEVIVILQRIIALGPNESQISQIDGQLKNFSKATRS